MTEPERGIANHFQFEMSLNFNLPAVLDLGIAAACVREAIRETGNWPVMLWKLGVAPTLGYPPAPARYDPAIGGALFAGFLVGRVWRMAAEAIRSSHVELHNLQLLPPSAIVAS
ncbi:hypothetical protein [Reyranella sp.]|uniref:hypothetical protein n=1 Tax=Reyranella sp. TaxID=1929291 RepID=UPI003D0C8A67